MNNYILEGKTPKKVDSVTEWGLWFEENGEKRVVAHSIVGRVNVSTVFLGIDHNFGSIRGGGNGNPILFETMIFGGKHDGYQDRYCTWDEAESGHKKVLEMLKPNFIMRIVGWFKNKIEWIKKHNK